MNQNISEMELNNRLIEIQEMKVQENKILSSLSEDEFVSYLANLYKNNKVAIKNSEYKVIVGG